MQRECCFLSIPPCTGGVPRNILAPAVWSYFRMAILRESLKKIHEDLFFSGLKGLSFEFLERAAAEFINKFLFSILYIPVYTLFRRYQHLGHYVAILSSSPSFLVKEVSQRLEAHTFLGTEYSLDEKGSLLLIDSFMDGTEKGAVIEALRKKRSLETSSSFKITSYSDSYEDLSFLLAADEAIAIRPDSRLKHVAKAKKWQIL